MAILDIPLTNVQPTLVSGTNIKTINGNSILGSGNLVIDSGVSIGDTIGSGTAGSVLFLGASGVLAQANANFFWDYTNNRLLLGGATLEARLSIKASTSNGLEHALRIVDSNNINLFRFRNDGYLVIGGGGTNSGIDIQSNSVWAGIYSPAYSSNSNNIIRYKDYVGNIRMSLDMSSTTKGFLGINNNTPSAVLDARATTATDTVIIAQGTTSQTGNLYENRLVGGTSGVSGWDANGNLFSNTSSGIQIATAATQKIGLWGATPIAQPTTAITAATYASVSGSFVKANDTFDGYTIGQVVRALRNKGDLA